MLPVWLIVRLPAPRETVPPAVTEPVTEPAVTVAPRRPPPLRLPIVSVVPLRSRMALALFARMTFERLPMAAPPEVRRVPSLMLVAPL